MGLYSSWDALAITNHVLIRISALRVGKKKFSDYLVLGDDVVIFNNEIEREYRKILTEIGVKYDPYDCYSCGKTHSLEIAKRLFREGKEISPIPLRLIKRDSSLFQFYLSERGFTSNSPPTIPGSTIRSQLSSNLLVF
jgi:hypothetical protein